MNQSLCDSTNVQQRNIGKSIAGSVGAEHPVFYEDKVDIHLNPKIGADWQLLGQQKRVVTPGQSDKYYPSGALHSGTGKVSYVGGNNKISALFISLLKNLKTTYRREKR